MYRAKTPGAQRIGVSSFYLLGVLRVLARDLGSPVAYQRPSAFIGGSCGSLVAPLEICANRQNLRIEEERWAERDPKRRAPRLGTRPPYRCRPFRVLSSIRVPPCPRCLSGGIHLPVPNPGTARSLRYVEENLQIFELCYGQMTISCVG